jgi:oxaloacetate decarboxylase alpha subunit
MARSPVGIADVTLRSLSRVVPAAHGSVGRVLPVVEELDAAGFALIDVWGDLSVAHCLSVWNESPWERLRAICARVEHAAAQMQLAGSCLVGTRPRPAAVVREFVAHAVDCGVRSFLVYEPLNDERNLERWLTACHDAGAQVRLAVVHPGATAGPADDTTALAARLAALGPEGICLKTGAALGPHKAPALVRELREAVSVPLEIDLDNAGGLAALTAALCADAGADIIYASTAPAWLDPAAVPVAVVMNVLQEGGLSSGLVPQAVAQAAERFASLGSPGDFEILAGLDLAADWPEVLQIPAAVVHQLAVRLREQGALERLREVVDETIAVRRDMGAKILVPPLSQVAGAQAVLNVLYGRRWQLVPDEMRAYLRGAYGAPPAPISSEVLAAVLDRWGIAAEDRPVEPPDEPAVEAGRPAPTPEDALLLKLVPSEAEAFFERRRSRFSLEGGADAEGGGDVVTAVNSWEDLGPERVRELVGILESSDVEELTVETGGTKVSLRKAGGPAPPAYHPPTAPASSAPAEAEEAAGGRTVTASMVGTFYRSPSPDAPPYVVQGQHVEAGDVLCLLEAMKLLNEVLAEVGGTITAVLVEDGAAVEYGQPLFVIEPD